MDKIMNEIYESGFKIGKKYYRDQIVMQSITDLFIEEKRDIPKELFLVMKLYIYFLYVYTMGVKNIGEIKEKNKVIYRC